MMEGVVLDAASAADLTEVLTSLDVVQQKLDSILAGQTVQTGVVLGVMVIIVLAVMFR